MTAAPPGRETWKAHLLAGDCGTRDRRPYRRDAGSDGALHPGRTPHGSEHALATATVFDELRLDPYYRATAARHPDLAAHFERLIEPRPLSLVHGDWSPKNFLVAGDSVMAIDFEVDPLRRPRLRFRLPDEPSSSEGDLSIRTRPGRGYRAAASRASRAGHWVEWATLQHLGALMLARVDGKSPAEYLDRGSQGARTALRPRSDPEPSAALARYLRPPMKIHAIRALEILDSRGEPTVSAASSWTTARRPRPTSPRALPPAPTKPSNSGDRRSTPIWGQGSTAGRRQRNRHPCAGAAQAWTLATRPH